MATRANEPWSWDITKLKGPAKWVYDYLYVILDVFGRYVVGWMIAARESATLAERLIAETCRHQGIAPGQLTLHADRGASMRSQPVALLLEDLGVTKTHFRPVDGQPVLKGAVQDGEVPARDPGAVCLAGACPPGARAALRLVQRHAPAQRARVLAAVGINKPVPRADEATNDFAGCPSIEALKLGRDSRTRDSGPIRRSERMTLLVEAH